MPHQGIRKNYTGSVISFNTSHLNNSSIAVIYPYIGDMIESCYNTINHNNDWNLKLSIQSLELSMRKELSINLLLRYTTSCLT